MTEDDQESIDQHRVAARLAARAQILDVRLLRTSAELIQQPDPDRKLRYQLDFDTNVDWDDDSPVRFVVRIACSLEVSFSDADDDADESDDDSIVAVCEFEYAALFSCDLREDDGPISEDEQIAYGSTTARFLLYPFIREYIHDTTSRLALPPLTIGVLARALP